MIFITAMRSVVLAEKEQLNSKPDLSLMPCGHRSAEHARALKSIEKKIQ